jgi:hypothetical protein
MRHQLPAARPLAGCKDYAFLRLLALARCLLAAAAPVCPPHGTAGVGVLTMLFALGAASSVWDVLQSLTTQSGTSSQTKVSSFEVTSPAAAPDSASAPCSSGNCSSQISAQTLSALIAAQDQATNSADSIGGAGNCTRSNCNSGGTAASASSTDPQGQIAGASTTTVTNADGSTTTSFTLVDGAKITLVTPGPRITSDALPSNLATSSYNLIEQAIQRDAQSLSANASASLSVNV